MLPRAESIFHIEEGGGDQRERKRRGARYACDLKGLQILIDRHSPSFDRLNNDRNNDCSSIVMNCPSLLLIDGRLRRRMRASFPQVQESGEVFLKACFLCKKELGPHKDVYMYRGEQGFCSEACRGRQIWLDETREMMEVNSWSRKMRPLKAAPPARAAAKIQESERRGRILAAVS